MVNETVNNSSSPEYDSRDFKDKPATSSGYVIISWMNHCIKTYKHNPPQALIRQYKEQYPELTHEQVLERLDIEVQNQFFLKVLDKAYDEYNASPLFPNPALFKKILMEKEAEAIL